MTGNKGYHFVCVVPTSCMAVFYFHFVLVSELPEKILGKDSLK